MKDKYVTQTTELWHRLFIALSCFVFLFLNSKEITKTVFENDKTFSMCGTNAVVWGLGWTHEEQN